MYELVMLTERTGYIDCPAKMGVFLSEPDKAVLIDAGNDKDAGKKALKVLDANGWQLQAVINTHLHADHCMGAQSLMDNGIPVGRLILPVGAEKMAVSEETLSLLDRLKGYCGQVTEAAAGDTWRTSRTEARVLWPERNGYRVGKDANDYCLCLEYRLGEMTVLFASDLTGTYEQYVGEPADVLKVAHHGSRASSTPDFLTRVSPRTAVISVSGNAEAARPDSAVQTRLRELGIQVYTTADCGAVRIRPEDGGYRVIPYIVK